MFRDVNTRFKINVKPLIVENVDAIQNGIFNCLFTLRGTRAWRPDFGSNLILLLQEPADANTATKIELEIKQNLQRWELRINVNQVQVNLLPTGDGYKVNIYYTIIASNGPGTVSFSVRR